ncbi:MAG: ABC transporter ATP-binding protein [Candidatus Omnitrophota bacterium]
MLKAHDLCKVYKEGPKDVYALKGINLEARKGEILAIIGPSGAGKSTLLHLLGGLDRPTDGKVFLGGVDLYKLSDRALCRVRNEMVGFVFQFYHLLPELTALENVMLPALIKKDKNRESATRAMRLLETVGLKERALHKPFGLSGGEAQRVAIARALINDPAIVFCDEPTGNLDSEKSVDLQNLIWRLSRESGKTFIVVTHEPSLAERADRILRIKDGVIAQDTAKHVIPVFAKQNTGI